MSGVITSVTPVMVAALGVGLSMVMVPLTAQSESVAVRSTLTV